MFISKDELELINRRLAMLEFNKAARESIKGATFTTSAMQGLQYQEDWAKKIEQEARRQDNELLKKKLAALEKFLNITYEQVEAHAVYKKKTNETPHR